MGIEKILLDKVLGALDIDEIIKGVLTGVTTGGQKGVITAKMRDELERAAIRVAGDLIDKSLDKALGKDGDGADYPGCALQPMLGLPPSLAACDAAHTEIEAYVTEAASEASGPKVKKVANEIRDGVKAIIARYRSGGPGSLPPG
jgi:hypothetical protein